MAGSYQHIVDSNNAFQGTDLLDHLGDAHDALEECWHMIRWLTGGDRRKIHEAWLEGYARPNLPPENMYLCTFEQWWGKDEEEPRG